MNMHAGQVTVSEMDNRERSVDRQLLMIYRMSRSAGWSAFFTFVIAVAIGACAYFYWQQLTVMQHQFDDMHELSSKVEKSLDASASQSAAALQAMQALSAQIGRTADAANQLAASVEKERDVTHPFVRPWVGIDAISVTPFRANQNATIRATIRNTGRSPATHVQVTLNALTALSRSVAIPELRQCEDCPRSVLLPNGTATAESIVDANVLSSEKIGKIQSGEEILILSGRIDYLDSSQNRHTTTACMILVPGSSAFGACREGNRFD